MLCHSGPVVSLPVLSLAGVFGRGHRGLYDALNSGIVDADRLRRLLAGRPIKKVRGQIVLAVDVTSWLRLDANCSPGRLYCHVTGHGRGQDSPEAATVTDTDRYGKLNAQAWEGLHPWLKQRSAWIDHHENLPIIEGTVIRTQSERLPHTGTSEPVWLWTSARGIDDELLDSLWSAWLRRFHIAKLKGQARASSTRPERP